MKRSIVEVVTPDEYAYDSSEDCDDPPANEGCLPPAAPAATQVIKKKAAPQKRRRVAIDKEKLTLDCQWKDCSFTSQDMMPFVDHVTTHISEMGVVPSEEDENENVYKCLWGECNRTMTEVVEVKIHVAYHGYYKHLTAYGAAVLSQENFPPCKRERTFKDCIPDEIELMLKDRIHCQWDTCTETFLNPFLFFSHIKCHANYASYDTEKQNQCKWKYCQKKCRKRYDLLNHMASHTLEKEVACPTCGFGYANLTKFYDHCARQIEEKTHECVHCKKLFSSERILKDHIRIHQNLYQCPFCEYKCSSASGMGVHVRVRHMPDKSFSCSLCSYQGKQKKNLVEHMNVHFSFAVYECSTADCSFSCRTKKSLLRHEFDKHGIGKLRCYICHLCGKNYKEGRILTCHLTKVHNFLSSTKLSYIIGDDGNYVLDPSMRGATEPAQPVQTELNPLFMAYDQIDEEGNITSKVLVGAQIINQIPQVLTLPLLEEGQPKPELQSLKAVPINSSNPPMFIMQSHMDALKRETGATVFEILPKTNAEEIHL